jgi:hypothetical protein
VGHIDDHQVEPEYVSRSASRNEASVRSEKTTPQPFVAPAGLRSTTVMSWPGWAALVSRAK